MVITHRVCTKCGFDKPLSDFHKAPRGKYGHKAQCKACDHAHRVALRAALPRKRKPMGPVPADRDLPKKCTRCGIEKPHSEFGISRKAKGNSIAVYRSHCKECSSTRAQQWYWENVDRAASNKRRSNLAQYGLTLEQYEELHIAQSGVCAICGEGEPAAHGRTGRKFLLSVDHCHETGIIRGLLCQRCNRAIGLLNDNTDLLKKAIDYLERRRFQSRKSQD